LQVLFQRIGTVETSRQFVLFCMICLLSILFGVRQRAESKIGFSLACIPSGHLTSSRYMCVVRVRICMSVVWCRLRQLNQSC